MPDTPRPLSIEVLERLEARLHADNAQPLEGSQGGLSANELAALTTAFPGKLPAEAQLWWTWRTWGEGRILPDTQYVPVDDCMKEYAFRREWATSHGVLPQAPEVGPDDWWHPLWLPIFVIDGGVVLVVDISCSNGTTAPIRTIDWQGFGGQHFARVAAASLGQYVADRLDAIDAGDYVYRTDIRLWTEVG